MNIEFHFVIEKSISNYIKKGPSKIFISTLEFSIIASYLEAEKPTVKTQIYKI